MQEVRQYKVGDPVRVDEENSGVVVSVEDGRDGIEYVIQRSVDGFWIIVPDLEMP